MILPEKMVLKDIDYTKMLNNLRKVLSSIKKVSLHKSTHIQYLHMTRIIRV